MTIPHADAVASGAALKWAVGSLSMALAMQSSYLLVDAVLQRQTLLTTKAGQHEPLQQAEKVRAQFTALATATARLAEQGHAGAKQVVEGMQREGITIKP